jgi:hypothetical protein
LGVRIKEPIDSVRHKKALQLLRAPSLWLIFKQKATPTLLLGSFCSEIFNLIPENLVPAASTSLLSELMKLEATGDRLSKEVYDVLQSQTVLLEEALGCLDKF